MSGTQPNAARKRPMVLPDPVAFWERVNRAGPIPGHVPAIGPCWIWTRGRTSQGYGMVVVGGRALGAHRISWMMEHGDIPRGQFVLHRCDTPACVRPEHLWLGSTKDNAADRQAKGRGGRGDGTARRAGRTRLLTTITLSPEAITRLDKIATARGQSRSAVVEQLIRKEPPR